MITKLEPSPGGRCPPRSRDADRARARRRPPTRSSRRSPARCPSTRARSRAPSARGVRTGVTEALRQFVDLIRDPVGGARARAARSTSALGRGELREGRTLDALQSAYRDRRAGRLAAAGRGRRARRDSTPTRSACSPSRSSPTSTSSRPIRSRAMREAQRASEGERRRRRRELLALLLRDPPADEADVRSAAAGRGVEAAAQRRPRSPWRRTDLARVARRLGPTRSPHPLAEWDAPSSPVPAERSRR